MDGAVETPPPRRRRERTCHAPPVRDRGSDRHPGGDPQGCPRLRGREDPARRHRARAQGRVPDRDRRGPQGARRLRPDDPRGVRRPGRVPADLRPRRGGDRPRLDERLRRHQHPLHRGLHAHAPRHRGAEAEVPPADGHRRGPRRLLDVRAGLRLRRRRHHHQGGVSTSRRGRRRLQDHRPEDVADQRRLVQPRRGAGQDRRGCRLGLQEHDHLPGREGGRLRRDRPGRHHPREDREDGLQGRRHHRDDPRRPRDLGRPDPRRGARQGLLPDDGRRRGRPRQRRRPRLRRRQPGLRARASPTPSSARPSARRSPSTRPCSSASRRWRPRSRPPTR